MSATTRADSARALRTLAKRVEQSHPLEATPAHLRDAAQAVEHGNHEGARRHLMAAMHTFEPRMLLRVGVMNDSGHARAKQDLGMVHRQYLKIHDIQDQESRADEQREARRAANGQAGGSTGVPARPVPEPPQLATPVDLAGFNPKELRGPGGKWAFGGSSGLKAPGPPGSFEHARWMDRVAETMPQSETRNAVHEATRAMIGRDLKTAHQHMANAIELDQLLAQGVHVGDLRKVDASLNAVPKHAALRNRARNPLEREAQHPGRYVESHLVSEPRTSMKYRAPNAAAAGGYASLSPTGIAGSPKINAGSIPPFLNTPATRAGLAAFGVGGSLSKDLRKMGKPRRKWTSSYANEITMAQQMEIAAIGLAMTDDEVAVLLRDEWMDFSAQTEALASTHRPFGKPGGPGLWKVKGMQLPAYIQNIARALLRTGRARDLGHAIAIARAATKRWAHGGGKVHPEVRAASAATGAEWEAGRARAHAHSNPVSLAREPYHREADETVQCPHCGKWDSPDAIYCDQCGRKLPDSVFAGAGEPSKVIELFNPNHAPPGTGGGQFVTAGGAGSAPGAAAAVKSTRKAALMAQVRVLRTQIAALHHALAAGTAPPAGTMASKAAKTGKAATRRAAAKAAPAKAKSKSSTPRKHGVTRMTARQRAQVRARISVLTAQLRTDLAKLRSGNF